MENLNNSMGNIENLGPQTTGKPIHTWKEAKRLKECYIILSEGIKGTITQLEEFNTKRSNLESVEEYVKMESLNDSNLEDEIKKIIGWKTRKFRGKTSQLLGRGLESTIEKGKRLLENMLKLSTSYEQYETIIRGHLIQIISLIMSIRSLHLNQLRISRRESKRDKSDTEERRIIINNWERQYGENMLQAFERLMDYLKGIKSDNNEQLDIKEIILIMDRIVKTCKRKRRHYYKLKRMHILNEEDISTLNEIKEIVLKEHE